MPTSSECKLLATMIAIVHHCWDESQTAVGTIVYPHNSSEQVCVNWLHHHRKRCKNREASIPVPPAFIACIRLPMQAEDIL